MCKGQAGTSMSMYVVISRESRNQNQGGETVKEGGCVCVCVRVRVRAS
jgi:hypothetical protein